MARPKRTAKVVALAAAIVPFLSAGLAGAAVTSPGASEVWRTGETKTIAWAALTDGTAGTFALSLYDNTDVQIDADPSDNDIDDIATGLNSATVTSYDWTIPTGLVGTGRYIKIHGDTGTTPWTGAAQNSVPFDIDHPLPAITAPVADAKWRVGTTKAITFIVPNGSTGTAKLVLTKNNVPVDLVADVITEEHPTEEVQPEITTGIDTAVATSYTWNIPSTLALGTGYRITLWGDAGETPFGGSPIDSGAFEIINDTGIYSPSGTSNWRELETHTIDFVAPEGATGTAALYLYDGTDNLDADPNPEGVQPIATGIDLATTDSYSWTIPAGVPLSDTMRLRLVGDGGEDEYTGAAVVSSPFVLRAAPPVPRFVVPGLNQRWHTGETKTITWVFPELSTGLFDLQLIDGNDDPVDINPATVGFDLFANEESSATLTSRSWTIPSGILGEGFRFVVIPGVGGSPRWHIGDSEDAPDSIYSEPFDIYAVGVTDLRIDTALADKAAISEKVTVNWHDDGTTGATVDLDLIRNDGTNTATTTSVVKGLAKSSVCNSTTHECEYIWTVSEKTAIDSGAGTYKLRLTPALGAADKTDAFAVTDRSLTLAAWGSAKSVKSGQPVVLEWVAAGNLGTLKIEAVPANNGGSPIVLEAKFDASKQKYTWYPTHLQAGKGYFLKVTSTAKSASTKAVFSSTMAAFATVAAQTQLTVGSISGLTNNAGKNGQPIVISWGFGELQNAAVKASPPMDISLVDSANKVTKIATGVLGDFDQQGKALRTYTYRPTGKVKAGSYTVRVTVTGSTDAGLTADTSSFAITAPTSITLDKPTASATVERGGQVEVEWTWAGKSELPVNINLLDSANKATSLAKNVVGTEGNGKGNMMVTIPGKGTSAGSYKIQVVSADFKDIKAEKAVTLASPTLAVSAPKGTGNNKVTWYKGKSAEVSWTLGDTGVAPVKLELIAAADKASAKPKVLATIDKAAKTVEGEGTVHFTPTAKLVSGDYVVRATAIDVSATAVVSDEFTLASAAIDAVTPPTGAVKGTTATVKWTLAQEATDDAKIELFQNGTIVAKIGTISKKATAYSGYGSFAWAIPATATAGTYQIKVTSLSDSSKTVTSSNFTIAAS